MYFETENDELTRTFLQVSPTPGMRLPSSPIMAVEAISNPCSCPGSDRFARGIPNDGARGER